MKYADDINPGKNYCDLLVLSIRVLMTKKEKKKSYRGIFKLKYT